MIIQGFKTLMMIWQVAAFPVLSHSQVSNLTFKHLAPNEGLTQAAVGRVLTDFKGCSYNRWIKDGRNNRTVFCIRPVVEADFGNSANCNNQHGNTANRPVPAAV